jgi:hypothetical protein
VVALTQLGIAPMFLKDNRRRAVRPVCRSPSQADRLIFEALAWLRLNPAHGHDPPTIPTPAPCRPDYWSCSRSTQPAHAGPADRSEAIMTPTTQPTLMCGTPG